MAVTAIGALTKLFYIEPGEYWNGWPYWREQTTSICDQPRRL